MATFSSQVWLLERYARLITAGLSKDGARNWQYFDNSECQLELSLTKDQLFIHHGRTFLESMSLRNSDRTMRGVCKGDSILIIYKIQNETRRFRMKFSPTKQLSAEEQCRSCVDLLTKYFPMKLTVSEPESQQLSSTPDPTKVLEGEVTLGKIAEAVLREDNNQLPSVYHRCSNIQPQSLNTVMKLCLADPTFPDFVDQVEKELEKIKHECA